MTACAVPTINLYSLSCSPSFYYRNSKRLADQARVQKNELRSKVIQDLLAAPSAFRQNGTHWKPLMGTSERCQEDNLCQLCTDHFRSLVLMEGNDFLLKFEDLFKNFLLSKEISLSATELCKSHCEATKNGLTNGTLLAVSPYLTPSAHARTPAVSSNSSTFRDFQPDKTKKIFCPWFSLKSQPCGSFFEIVLSFFTAAKPTTRQTESTCPNTITIFWGMRCRPSVS